MQQVLLWTQLLFISFCSLAQCSEPLAFHWKQAKMTTATGDKIHIKLIMRSLQQFPVDLLQGELTLYCYARAKKGGFLQLDLNGSIDKHDAQVTRQSQAGTTFDWFFKSSQVLQVQLSGTEMIGLFTGNEIKLSGKVFTQLLIPATHEIALDTTCLSWLEELFIYIENAQRAVPDEHVNPVAHLIHTSGTCHQLKYPADSPLSFRPGFLSVFINPEDPIQKEAMTVEFGIQIMKWINRLTEKRLQDIKSGEPDPKRRKKIQYSLSQVNKPIISAIGSHPVKISDFHETNLHRYHLTNPVYSEITDKASQQISQGKGLPSKVDSWGGFTGHAGVDKTALDKAILEHLTQCSSPRYNAKIYQDTYPALIFDTDPRQGLSGQLGLFARRALPPFHIIGAYGGILCHYTEQSDIEQRFGARARDYFHGTGPETGARKRLTISPYQHGNLLSLCNTDRFDECTPNPDYHRNINTLNARLQGISHIVFITQQAIPQDCELLIDYGPDKQKTLRGDNSVSSYSSATTEKRSTTSLPTTACRARRKRPNDQDAEIKTKKPKPTFQKARLPIKTIIRRRPKQPSFPIR